MSIHPATKAQIAWLVAEKIKIPAEYLDYLDVFLEKKAWVLSKLNQHAIKLQES